MFCILIMSHVFNILVSVKDKVTPSQNGTTVTASLLQFRNNYFDVTEYVNVIIIYGLET